MRIARRYTRAGQDAYSDIAFVTSRSTMTGPDGTALFDLEAVEAPQAWSAIAVDVMAQKYLRKAGVPVKTKPKPEKGVPDWLVRSVPDEDALAKMPANERTSGETSAKQLFDRMAGGWTYWAWTSGVFDAEEDAQAFNDELRYMLAAQIAAPNSPQWFNGGLNWAYGLEGGARLGADLNEALLASAIELIALPKRVRIGALRGDDRDSAVGDEKVEPSVVVVVEPARAEAGIRQAHAAKAKAVDRKSVV